jgi:molybdate transport system substrate-binding protein
VAVAASAKPALERLAGAFEEAHAGTEIALTAGASGVFFAQVREGAPFDVFFSADRDYPRRLAAEGLGRREVVYAVGALVVWTRQGLDLDLAGAGLRALGHPSVKKIAIANPAVAPYGRAALAALEAEGALPAVRDRLVLGQSVAQAAHFAASGAADAAIVPRPIALSSTLAGGTIHPVRAASHPPQEHAATILAAAKDAALAEEFLAFVTGPHGRALLADAGYDLPGRP